MFKSRNCAGWVVVFLAGALAAGCGFLPRGYVFDPSDLEEIVDQITATSGEDAVQQVHDALLDRGYPVATEPNWVINSGRGVPGQVAAFYLYANEYLVVAGVNPGAQWSMAPGLGFEVHDYVLFGDLTAYAAGELNPPTLGPGDSLSLGPFESRQFRTDTGVWMLEYGRGLLPTDLYPEAFAGEFALAQNAILYASGSFVTSFIRNWVYEQIGLPGGIFSLYGL
ncbi:MAG TPA: hypothetical protein PLL20_09625 [Phycisphaerae bacterium]|nr:hypothetical protein [Phycisphaerae bacterium]HRR85661.1 hypothetical protein [Phycisphaerae bacterium]